MVLPITAASLTQGWAVYDVLGFVAGVGFAGGLVGYCIAAVRQALGYPPRFGFFMQHFTMVPGVGASAFVVFDLLAIH